MCQRIKALGAKKWFVKDNPKATGYTAEDIKKMSVPMLSKKMVGYTQNIPGTRSSKTRLRKIILAMVRQIEIETHREPHYLVTWNPHVLRSRNSFGGLLVRVE